MSSLLGKTPSNTFPQLLHFGGQAGVDATLQIIEDGLGIATPLKLSTTQISLNDIVWPSTGAVGGKVLGLAADGVTAVWMDGGNSSNAPYDVSFAALGSPTANAIVQFYTFPRNATLPTDASGSFARCMTASTVQDSVFTVFKNNTSIGTVTFPVGSMIGFCTITATEFIPGDMLVVRAPSPQNASLAGVSVTLSFTL